MHSEKAALLLNEGNISRKHRNLHTILIVISCLLVGAFTARYGYRHLQQESDFEVPLSKQLPLTGECYDGYKATRTDHGKVVFQGGVNYIATLSGRNRLNSIKECISKARAKNLGNVDLVITKGGLEAFRCGTFDASQIKSDCCAEYIVLEHGCTLDRGRACSLECNSMATCPYPDTCVCDEGFSGDGLICTAEDIGNQCLKYAGTRDMEFACCGKPNEISCGPGYLRKKPEIDECGGSCNCAVDSTIRSYSCVPEGSQCTKRDSRPLVGLYEACCGKPDEISCGTGFVRKDPEIDECGGYCNKNWCKHPINGRVVRSYSCVVDTTASSQNQVQPNV